MVDLENDSGLRTVLKRADRVMSALVKGKATNTELLERAYKMAAATRSFTGSETLSVEKKAQEVKERIGLHLDLLKNTASSMSLLKEKCDGSGDGRNRTRAENCFSIPMTANRKLSEYNQQIDLALKQLAVQTGGNTKVEAKLKKYRKIMGDVEGSLKGVPSSIKDATKKTKTKKPKGLENKLAEKLNKDTLELMQKIRKTQGNDYRGFDLGNISDDDSGKEIGELGEYEGFRSKDDLDRYNKMFKKYVGESPEEHAKKQQKKKPEYRLDEMGKLIFDESILSEPTPKVNLFSAYARAPREQELLKTCQDSEIRLRQILAKRPGAAGGDGTSPGTSSSLLSDKKFLDEYVEKKLKSLDSKPQKSSKKILNPEVKRPKPGTSTVSSGLQSYLKKQMEATENNRKFLFSDTEEITPPGSASEEPSSTSTKAAKSLPKTGDVLYDLAKPKPELTKRPPVERTMETDMSTINKLIQKEKNELLRKKRDEWERNNELRDDPVERAEMKELMKSLPKSRETPFEVTTAKNLPSPSDFLTRRDAHDKVYRKATEVKNSLKYELGVNPFYRTNKEEESDKTKMISTKKYSGVRKK